MRTNHPTTASQKPFFLHDAADLVGKSLPYYTLSPLSLRSGQLPIFAKEAVNFYRILSNYIIINKMEG